MIGDGNFDNLGGGTQSLSSITLSESSIRSLADGISGSLSQALRSILPSILSAVHNVAGYLNGSNQYSSANFLSSLGGSNAFSQATAMSAYSRGVVNKNAYAWNMANSLGLVGRGDTPASATAKLAAMPGAMGMMDDTLRNAYKVAQEQTGKNPLYELQVRQANTRKQAYNIEQDKLLSNINKMGDDDAKLLFGEDHVKTRRSFKTFEEAQAAMLARRSELDEKRPELEEQLKEAKAAAKAAKRSRSTMAKLVADDRVRNLESELNNSDAFDKAYARHMQEGAGRLESIKTGKMDDQISNIVSESEREAYEKSISVDELQRRYGLSKTRATQYNKMFSKPGGTAAARRFVEDQAEKAKTPVGRKVIENSDLYKQTHKTGDLSRSEQIFSLQGMADLIVNEVTSRSPEELTNLNLDPRLESIYAFGRAAGSTENFRSTVRNIVKDPSAFLRSDDYDMVLSNQWKSMKPQEKNIYGSYEKFADSQRKDMERRLGSSNEKELRGATMDLLSGVGEATRNNYELRAAGAAKLKNEISVFAGGDENEAKTVSDILSQMEGVKDIDSMSREAQKRSKDFVKFLRMSGRGAEDITEAFDDVGNLLSRLNIPRFDAFGRKTGTAASLARNVLVESTALMNSGLMDKQTADVVARETQRDRLGSKEGGYLASVTGLLKLRGREDLAEEIGKAGSGKSVAEINKMLTDKGLSDVAENLTTMDADTKAILVDQGAGYVDAVKAKQAANLGAVASDKTIQAARAIFGNAKFDAGNLGNKANRDFLNSLGVDNDTIDAFMANPEEMRKKLRNGDERDQAMLRAIDLAGRGDMTEGSEDRKKFNAAFALSGVTAKNSGSTFDADNIAKFNETAKAAGAKIPEKDLPPDANPDPELPSATVQAGIDNFDSQVKEISSQVQATKEKFEAIDKLSSSVFEKLGAVAAALSSAAEALTAAAGDQQNAAAQASEAFTAGGTT